jgi:hypothetical protein
MQIIPQTLHDTNVITPISIYCYNIKTIEPVYHQEPNPTE